MNRDIETILLGVRRSSKIVGRDVAKKGLSGMRVFAVVLALSIMLTAAVTYAQAPAPAPAAPATQKPAPRPRQPPADRSQPRRPARAGSRTA